MTYYDGITIIQDTREKIGANDIIENYFKDNGVKILRSKLPYGDYALLGNWELIIDTKESFLECENCLTKDHVRFRNEIIGANEHNIYLIILIEEKYNYISLEEFKEHYQIPKWKSTTNKHKRGQPMAQFNVETIVKAMETMQQKYEVLFLFTTPEDCPKKMLDILVDNRKKYLDYFEKKRGIKNGV